MRVVATPHSTCYEDLGLGWGEGLGQQLHLVDRVNPWSLEHLLFCWLVSCLQPLPRWGRVTEDAEGGSREGEHGYSEEPCSVTALNPWHARDARVSLPGSHLVPELGEGAARWEQERMAKDLQGCMNQFFTWMITEIKFVGSGPGSSITGRSQSS